MVEMKETYIENAFEIVLNHPINFKSHNISGLIDFGLTIKVQKDMKRSFNKQVVKLDY